MPRLSSEQKLALKAAAERIAEEAAHDEEAPVQRVATMSLSPVRWNSGDRVHAASRAQAFRRALSQDSDGQCGWLIHIDVDVAAAVSAPPPVARVVSLDTYMPQASPLALPPPDASLPASMLH